MIDRPKHSSYYAGRTEDCVNALEPRFVALLAELRGSYFDGENITAVLIGEAAKSGWAQHEVNDAMGTLTSVVDPATRRQNYTQEGWKGFDPALDPYTADQIAADRSRYPRV